MCEPIPRCIVVESLKNGRVFTARIPAGADPMELAEDIVEVNGFLPDERWRWGTVDVEDPRVARIAHPVVVDWDPGVYMQRVEGDEWDEDSKETGT